MPRNINNITQTNGYTVIKPNIPLEWSSMYMAKTNQGTGYCGKIIPVFHKELMPNQTVNIEQSLAIQFTPFVSNLFHQIRGELMSFFVPYRICAFLRDEETIDEDMEEEADQLKWQAFITGGKDGQDSQKLETIDWVHTSYAENQANGIKHTLWDYFGYPTDAPAGEDWQDSSETNPPNKLLHNAYNLIYNTKFRNPDYTEFKYMKLRGIAKFYRTVNETATAYWNADRFTRARKAQYRGIAPTIPITNEIITLAHELTSNNPNTGLTNQIQISQSVDQDLANQLNTTWVTQNGEIDGSVSVDDHTIPKGGIDLKLDYNEFLYNIGILKYETNNARIKPLYVEHLRYRFGIIPQDSRFQEPEWISSNSFDIGIDTVENNSGSTQISSSGGQTVYTQNNQGKITSQGWGAGRGLRSEYKAQEHGVFMTLMIIRPEGVYEGGLQRQCWGTRTRFDFPTPEMMNLPDQKIYKGEIKWTGVLDDDKGLFGWEQIYDEYRSETNQVCGLLRPSIPSGGLPTYTLARYFNSQPELNDDFLKCNPDMGRIKQYQSQPDFIFFVRSEIKTALPMPMINEPINIGM